MEARRYRVRLTSGFRNKCLHFRNLAEQSIWPNADVSKDGFLQAGNPEEAWEDAIRGTGAEKLWERNSIYFFDELVCAIQYGIYRLGSNVNQPPVHGAIPERAHDHARVPDEEIQCWKKLYDEADAAYGVAKGYIGCGTAMLASELLRILAIFGNFIGGYIGGPYYSVYGRRRGKGPGSATVRVVSPAGQGTVRTPLKGFEPPAPDGEAGDRPEAGGTAASGTGASPAAAASGAGGGSYSEPVCPWASQPPAGSPEAENAKLSLGPDGKPLGAFHSAAWPLVNSMLPFYKQSFLVTQDRFDENDEIHYRQVPYVVQKEALLVAYKLCSWAFEALREVYSQVKPPKRPRTMAESVGFDCAIELAAAASTALSAWVCDAPDCLFDHRDKEGRKWHLATMLNSYPKGPQQHEKSHFARIGNSMVAVYSAMQCATMKVTSMQDGRSLEKPGPRYIRLMQWSSELLDSYTVLVHALAHIAARCHGRPPLPPETKSGIDGPVVFLAHGFDTHLRGLLAGERYDPIEGQVAVKVQRISSMPSKEAASVLNTSTAIEATPGEVQPDYHDEDMEDTAGEVDYASRTCKYGVAVADEESCSAFDVQMTGRIPLLDPAMLAECPWMSAPAGTLRNRHAGEDLMRGMRLLFGHQSDCTFRMVRWQKRLKAGKEKLSECGEPEMARRVRDGNIVRLAWIPDWYRHLKELLDLASEDIDKRCMPHALIPMGRLAALFLMRMPRAKMRTILKGLSIQPTIKEGEYAADIPDDPSMADMVIKLLRALVAGPMTYLFLIHAECTLGQKSQETPWPFSYPACTRRAEAWVAMLELYTAALLRGFPVLVLPNLSTVLAFPMQEDEDPVLMRMLHDTKQEYKVAEMPSDYNPVNMPELTTRAIKRMGVRPAWYDGPIEGQLVGDRETVAKALLLADGVRMARRRAQIVRMRTAAVRHAMN